MRGVRFPSKSLHAPGVPLEHAVTLIEQADSGVEARNARERGAPA